MWSKQSSNILTVLKATEVAESTRGVMNEDSSQVRLRMGGKREKTQESMIA